VITSAFGSGSGRKSIDLAETRSARPATAIFRSAIDVTPGRSTEVARRCGCLRAASTSAASAASFSWAADSIAVEIPSAGAST
jgi:hypothetical protein